MAKTIYSRMQQKHDFEANWLETTGFTPFKGEIVVYDAESTDGSTLLEGASLPSGRTTPYTYARFKIGDGVSNVNDLPFADENIKIEVDTALSTTSENPVQNKVITNALNNKMDKNPDDITVSDDNYGYVRMNFRTDNPITGEYEDLASFAIYDENTLDKTILNRDGITLYENDATNVYSKSWQELLSDDEPMVYKVLADATAKISDASDDWTHCRTEGLYLVEGVRSGWDYTYVADQDIYELSNLYDEYTGSGDVIIFGSKDFDSESYPHHYAVLYFSNPPSTGDYIYIDNDLNVYTCYSGLLPDITSFDRGKILQVDSSGKWTKQSLPTASTSNAGMVQLSSSTTSSSTTTAATSSAVKAINDAKMDKKPNLIEVGEGDESPIKINGNERRIAIDSWAGSLIDLDGTGDSGKVVLSDIDGYDYLTITTSDGIRYLHTDPAGDETIYQKTWPEILEDSGGITEETDPTVPTHVKEISEDDINSWNNKLNKDETITFGSSDVDETTSYGLNNIEMQITYDHGASARLEPGRIEIHGCEGTSDNHFGVYTGGPEDDNVNVYGSDNVKEAFQSFLSVPTKTSQLTNDSDYATNSSVDTKVANLVDTAPEALNTLNELAAALGDDPNFATTVATEIGKKVDKTTTVNGHALSGNITLTKFDIADLDKVDNTADANKSVNYAISAGTATKAVYDGNGNNIVDHYATRGSIANLAQWLSDYDLIDSILVEGDKETYYPVVISLTAVKSMPTKISVWKDLHSQTPDYSGNHSNGTSSMWLIYEGRNCQWDGNGGYLKTLYHFMPYANLCAHATVDNGSAGNFIIWLRGGGCSYNIANTNRISAPRIYYENTTIGITEVGPRTGSTSKDNNYGIFKGPTQYFDITGHASTADKATQIAITQTDYNGFLPVLISNANVDTSGAFVSSDNKVAINAYTGTIKATEFNGYLNGTAANANYLSTYPALASIEGGNIEALQNIFDTVPKSVGTAVRIEKSSHSMAFGWFLDGYSKENAYGGWFISDYGTPSWVGVSDGQWHSSQFITTENIGSQSVNYANSAGSVAWANVSGKPTIPTVNNATLTIQKNGSNVATFTANSASNATANITVPTKVSELTNDSGFVKSGEAQKIGEEYYTNIEGGAVTVVADADQGADASLRPGELYLGACYGATESNFRLKVGDEQTSNPVVESTPGVREAFRNWLGEFSSAVTSVNGQTGAVTLSIPTAVSQLTNDSGYKTTDTNYYHTRAYSSGLKIATGTGVSDLYVPNASTSAAGIVQLSAATNSTSTTLAATASAVKSAYDLAKNKSTVSFSRSLASGTKIGTITINGTGTDIYAPVGGATSLLTGSNGNTWIYAGAGGIQLGTEEGYAHADIGITGATFADDDNGHAVIIGNSGYIRIESFGETALQISNGEVVGNDETRQAFRTWLGIG